MRITSWPALLLLVLILFGLAILHQNYINNLPLISTEKAIEIAKIYPNLKKFNQALLFESPALDEKSIRAMHKIGHTKTILSLSPASTPKQMFINLQLLRYIQNKYPYSYHEPDDRTYFLFENELVFFVLGWILYIYFITRSVNNLIPFLGLISLSLINPYLWNGVTFVMVTSLAFTTYPILTFFSASNVKSKIIGRYKNFKPFSIIKLLPITFIITGVILIFLLIFYHFPISNYLHFIENFNFPTLFYFVFPWLVLFLLILYLATIHFGIFEDEESICVLSLVRMPLLLKKEDLKEITIKKNKISISFKDNRQDILINQFYMKDQVLTF